MFTLKNVYDIITLELLDRYRGDKMNQILDYDPNKKTGGSSSGSDKIVRVFAILLVVFAIALLSSGVYGIYKNNQTQKESAKKPNYAKITAEQEENGKVKVLVNHDKAIEKMYYSWNTNKERSVKGQGAKSLEEEIDLPAGTNTLHIKVVDIDGIETSFEQEFIAEDGSDIISPVISMKVVVGEDKTKKLKITATDETKLDFITYRWNRDEETKVEAEEENQKEIIVEIDILKGENDITISAVDSSNNNTTETKSFKGLTEPEISVYLSEDGTALDILVKHENGISNIYYTLNGKEYQANFDNEEGELKNPKEISFSQPLDVGDNRLILTATSVDETEKVYDGFCTYTPPQQEEQTQESQQYDEQQQEQTQ